MPTKTPTSVYRSLVKEAFLLTRTRKTLWVFGLFAGLISTGGVMESAIRTFKTVEQSREIFLSAIYGSLPGITTLGQLIHTGAELGKERASIAIALTILGAILLLYACLTSQAALVMGVEDRQAKGMKKTVVESRGHAVQILVLNILSKGAAFILLFLTALPLTLFTLRGGALDAGLFLVIFLLLIPASIAIATITVLALFSIVRENRHALAAIDRAITLYKTHWIACFEFGLLLFILSLCGSLALFFLTLLAVIPYALLVFGALMTQIPLLYVGINAFGIFSFFFVLFLGFGAIVTFQYAAWSLFYDKLLLKGVQKLKAKIHRLWAK